MPVPARAEPYPALSYELYPPRSPAAVPGLWRSIRRLEETAPDYVSVTYGAGGGNHDTAVDLLTGLQDRTCLRPVAHLTCVGNDRPAAVETVETLLHRGIRGFLALRGDLPDGESPRSRADAELPHALDLVRLIRKVEARRAAHLAGGRVCVGVAAYPSRHPESPTLTHDLEVLLAKQQAGADFAVTQLFFRAEDYTDLLRRARRVGITIPIVPGVMPLTSVRRIDRLATLAGIEPDARLRDRLRAADDVSRHRIGVEATADLARAALDAGAPGLHLYTFNDATPALDVLDSLALPRPDAERVPA